MIRVLGVLDIIASILLFITPFFNLPDRLVWIFAVYLIIKGVIFILSIISIVDVAGGAILLISLTHFAIPRTIVFILAFLILQKGIFSLLGGEG